jgi:hypothetical protein
MSKTNDELEAMIGVLSQRLAQLPTRDQINTLTDLLNSFKSETNQLLTMLTSQNTALQAQVNDLLARVQALETP